ncbi:hypothetical protein E2C01_056029 [Portunus trituberculatus]|uniref:Uncharacterized protein n=1 Tax=Portunus trituberculatus TaxID=210409 RepID=A0A5B7GPA2_PORTR|nr:hypothetical protein [Portunus trituberculatus]
MVVVVVVVVTEEGKGERRTLMINTTRRRKVHAEVAVARFHSLPGGRQRHSGQEYMSSSQVAASRTAGVRRDVREGSNGASFASELYGRMKMFISFLQLFSSLFCTIDVLFLCFLLDLLTSNYVEGIALFFSDCFWFYYSIIVFSSSLN